MKPHEQTIFNSVGKLLAPHLSRVVASSRVAGLSQLADTYLCILLGKGAGSGWALDAEIRAALRLIHNPLPVIFDVGANTGEWAARMHTRIPKARIFMFEPQSTCRQAIAAKAIPNSVLIPCAASAQNGPATLYTPSGTTGIASLYQRRDTYFVGEQFSAVQVQTVRIDDVLDQQNIERVDFLKLDIEGHELEALKGAVHSLESGKIKALSFEFGSGNINSRTFFRDFYDLLHPLKYKMFRILPSSSVLPIEEYDETCEYFRGVSNYLAVLDEPG